jgi:hypothetical protein
VEIFTLDFALINVGRNFDIELGWPFFPWLDFSFSIGN